MRPGGVSRGDSGLSLLNSTCIQQTVDGLVSGASTADMLSFAAALVGALAFECPHEADLLSALFRDGDDVDESCIQDSEWFVNEIRYCLGTSLINRWPTMAIHHHS